MKIVEFAYMLHVEFTTEGRDDTVPDWPPHPQATSVLRRDEVAEVDLETALLRANNDGAAVNSSQRRKKKNEPHRLTASDENCARRMDGRNEFFLETIKISTSRCGRLREAMLWQQTLRLLGRIL